MLKRAAKSIVNRLLSSTPYHVTRKRTHPQPTFNPVRLGLAYYFAENPSGTLLQVGAFDGVSNDPVSDFIRQGHARAILVEPVEANFRKLQTAYQGSGNVSLVQAALAHEDGNVSLYRAKDNGRFQEEKWIGQIASFNRRHLLKHGLRDDEIEEVSVPALSMASLLSRFGLKSVDFLQIDTEGFDAEVVKMALTLPVRPAFINFEHAHLGERTILDLLEQLKQHGYTWIQGRYDTFAVHQRVTERWKAAKDSGGGAATHHHE